VLAAGPHAEVIPASYAALGRLLLEVLDLKDVNAAALGAVEAKTLYAAFTDTLPPPKVEAKRPEFDWRKVWSRLVTTGLPPLAVDTAFSMLHKILSLQVRRHRLRLADSPACRRCGAPVEDSLHFFTACPRLVDAWGCLAAAAGRALGGPLPDTHLLHLHLPIHPRELSVALAVVVFVHFAWAARDDQEPLAVAAYLVAVRAAIQPHLVNIFV
jgi:hypothetical protein